MKRRFLFLISTYFLFVFLFVMQKPLFMLHYYDLFAEVSLGEWWKVIIHGLPLDFSLAGYLTIIPGLLTIASVWNAGKWLRRTLMVYYIFIAILLSAIFVLDVNLYEYWGFRLDTTPFFYFFSSPTDAFASTGVGIAIKNILLWCAYGIFLFFAFMAPQLWLRGLKTPFHRLYPGLLFLVLTGLLFIPIRGGFTVSTMNTGKVYFSDTQTLNHAAINPAFSLMESFSRQANFDQQYRFMEPEKADEIFLEITDAVPADSIPQLFTIKQPNVIFIVLESFSSYLMESLGGEAIAVEVDSMAREGILFTNFYANSFRTDRGLVSIFSGYPAQPTTSIMKYSRKTQNLPSIPRSLKSAGYTPYYYYGGDADFTNMRSYLISMGIEDIVCDKNFPASQRLSKWGAHDEVVFNRLIEDMKKDEFKEPFCIALQTSSSHEPFEVPYRKFENKKVNAFAYADSCTGEFIREFKQLPLWKESVVVLVPDHLGAYPENINNQSAERYRIPLIITGGAVKEPMQIDSYGSQIDIAATLLYQLGIPHDEFTFSKNLLNPASPKFGYFTSPNFFGMITPENEFVYDCDADQILINSGTMPGMNDEKGKALLQKLYDDLATR